MSERARDVLKCADAVVGYTTYIELIRPLIQDKQIVSTAMKKEIERVEAAIDMAREGKSCAIVSSGDPGIYAMAGLVFEMCQKKGIPLTRSEEAGGMSGEGIRVEVVPGIPALCSGASLLGAPLTHDFATISLSDLLTPWEKIEQRIEAAAEADFVLVFYNPKSKKRNWQLEAAQKIILRYRDRNTPAGIVTSAMRDAQSVRVVPLGELHTAHVDMQTTVFIGNSTTTTYSGFMVTPRGYAEKYPMTD